jgi:hypothetical protein
MKTRRASSLLPAFLILAFVLSACSMSVVQPTSTPAPTDTPQPTATITLTPTNTPRPSPTLRPTKTPNLAATERIEGFNAEAQSYFDQGYLTTADGKFNEYDDFEVEWAQLNWFRRWDLDQTASDFYMSAHFKWSSAFQNADISGCGFIFAATEDNLYYAVFLDRTQVLFLTKNANGIRELGKTRGVGTVRFDNPAEADFTLIVKGAYAYALVDGEVIGEYTLSQSKPLRGTLGLTVLSGTNKDYGTRCEMTDIRVWTPNE